jgi:hypothetical protein
VGYDCFGIREIPGVAATLVPSGDIKALIGALKENLQVLATAGRPAPDVHFPALQAAMRQQFDMGKMVRETWEVYQPLLRN